MVLYLSCPVGDSKKIKKFLTNEMSFDILLKLSLERTTGTLITEQ